MLFDSETENDEEITPRGENCVEEKWLQLTEQDNSNTCSHVVIKVYFRKTGTKFCCSDPIRTR